ncbi:hypothetical protein ADAWI_63 [Mycobacterium phage Adawi]|uniref:Uncharacterized protein n=1 Tax=Mycobacterium phage Adawi TaxID=1354507 RepID=T2A8X6_9CAUD|nr:hypothetical protein ADAWI_63 [Mycobacterium phage Adawi]AGU91977.1 hypothetical protein ADAWI_63 [Mycobacterium phage Adawi]
MDEWPELERLAQAVDAWDEWPLSPIYDRAAAVIDAARDVVANYRESKALIEHYKNMPPITLDTLRREGLVTEAQYRRQVGLPPAPEQGVKACIEIPVPEGYDEGDDPVVRHARKVWDDFGQAMQPGHPTVHVPREEPGGDRPRDH